MNDDYKGADSAAAPEAIITTGETGPDWEPTDETRFYAQRGGGEFSFGPTAEAAHDALLEKEAANKKREDQMRSALAKRVMFGYTNHRGEFGIRHAVPHAIIFTTTEYHEGEQWFLYAFDIDKQANRHFALRDVDFTVMEAVPDAPAADEANDLHASVSAVIFSNYIGVSASRTKADKAATAALTTVQGFYEQMAAREGPQA